MTGDGVTRCNTRAGAAGAILQSTLATQLAGDTLESLPNPTRKMNAGKLFMSLWLTTNDENVRRVVYGADERGGRQRLIAPGAMEPEGKFSPGRYQNNELLPLR